MQGGKIRSAVVCELAETSIYEKGCFLRINDKEEK
jgi:hypothetical protein